MVIPRVKIKQSLLGLAIGAILLASPMIGEAATVVSNLAYNASIGTYGLGNLYLPKDYTADTPVALAIHGGGWSGLDRASWAGVAEFLCNDLGFAVFNIEYRLTGVGPWPLCGNDCIDAANYLLSETFTQRFGIRCRKVWPCGGSSGGHLALWTGMSLPPGQVGGVISISGIGDLIPDAAANPSRYGAGGLFGHTPSQAELIAASPMTLVTSNSPPVFCSHATTDTVVPPASTQHFVDACRAAGVRVEHYTYAQRDTGHSIWTPGSDPHRLFADIEAAIAQFVWSYSVTGYVVGQDEFYTELGVKNDVTLVRPLIDQTVRKTGAGSVALLNPRMTRAEMQVLQGGVAVAVSDTFAPPALPAALRQKAAFWVDANTNVVADAGGRVSRWHDVREASVDGVHQYMMATNAEAVRQPTLVSDAALGGKRYLDFGSWGPQDTNVNSRWLFWADTNGVAKTLDLRAAFIVFGSHNGSAGGGICLIQNATSLSPAPTAPFAGASDRLWLSSANVLADDAVNYLDRQMRDGRNLQIFDKAYHLVETFTLQAAKANDFAKDRTYPGYSGGSRICEGLFFITELTDAERLQVQDYLWHRWFGRRGETSVGTFRMANASALDFVVGTNGVQAAVAGDGAVSKSGAGMLALQNAGEGAFDGTVRLREGGLLVAGEPFLFEIEEGGQTIDARGQTVTRTSAAAGKVVKTGSNEWAVASVSASVARIEVAGGTLRLATPRVTNAESAGEAAVTNWSFEGLLLSGTSTLYKNTTAGGWTFTQNMTYYTGNHVGVVADGDSTFGLISGSVPNGEIVLYLNRGAAETEFTVKDAGQYRLEFFAAARTGNLNLHIEVYVDGRLLNMIVTVSPTFLRYEMWLPFLATGKHTLKFQGQAPGTIMTRASFVDAVRVVPVTLCREAPVLATVTNAGFEWPVELFEAAVVTNEPAGTGWTFSGQAGMGRIQTLNSSPRSMPLTVPEGIAAAVLPASGGIRQTVTFPTSGVYRLTFAMAARPGRINHTFQVFFGGVAVQSFTTTDTAFQRVELLLPSVATGAEVELAFEGTGAANTASVIDDIRIERVGAAESAARSRQSVGGRFPETTALAVAAGVRLALDFEGQIKVAEVTYSGQVVSGVINASTHPEFAEGTGSIFSPSKKTLIMVH